MNLSNVAEPVFDFEVAFDEPVNRRSAESQSEEGEKLFERSEFFSPRLNRALQGTRAFFAGAVKWR